MFIFLKSAELNMLEASLTSSTSSLFSSISSANTPQKSISEIFESSLTPTGPLVIIKYQKKRYFLLNYNLI